MSGLCVRPQRLQFRFHYESQDTNRYHHQSVSKLQAWVHVNAVCFVSYNLECCQAWDLVGQAPPGAQPSQHSSPILSMVLQVLHSQQAVIPGHLQSGQCPGRLEARSEACFLSFFFFFFSFYYIFKPETLY